MQDTPVLDPCACGIKEASDCGCGPAPAVSSGCGTGHQMPVGGCGSGCSCASRGPSMISNVRMIADDGREVNCLVLDSFEFEGKTYIAILPESSDGETTEEPILLNSVVVGMSTSLTSIEDKEELERVTDYFKGYFDFNSVL